MLGPNWVFGIRVWILNPAIPNFACGFIVEIDVCTYMVLKSVNYRY